MEKNDGGMKVEQIDLAIFRGKKTKGELVHNKNFFCFPTNSTRSKPLTIHCLSKYLSFLPFRLKALSLFQAALLLCQLQTISITFCRPQDLLLLLIYLSNTPLLFLSLIDVREMLLHNFLSVSRISLSFSPTVDFIREPSLLFLLYFRSEEPFFLALTLPHCLRMKREPPHRSPYVRFALSIFLLLYSRVMRVSSLCERDFYPPGPLLQQFEVKNKTRNAAGC